jgi:transglutaminase-like putative cysteine protease
MHYAIQHITRYQYGAPIVENVMEVRLQPRSDELQQCLSFHLYLRPAARVHPFRDHLDNWVHFYDIAAAHKELTITANSVVHVLPPPEIPVSLPIESWERMDMLAQTSAHWEWMQPSHFTPATPALYGLVAEFGVDRSADPLTTLRRMMDQLHSTFSYDTESTRVDSPIDEAIASRSGVCQDFTHIMLALLRHVLRIPCRYVSGYLFHRDDDRSDDDATHAWVEALLPELGWVGFDPTNNLIAGERHIRVALGRDYADVPPTHGIFRGAVESDLSVTVKVKKAAAPLPIAESEPAPRWRYEASASDGDATQVQQQQQQQ